MFKNIIDIKNFPVYLFYIFPLILITGPFLADLSVIIINSWFLFKIIKDKQIINQFLKNKIFLYFILFNILLVISSLASDYVLFSIKSSLFYFRFYLFSFAICYILENYHKAKFYFFLSLIISLFLIFVSSIYELIFIKIFFTSIDISSGELTRISGLYGDELIMGGQVKNIFILFLILFIQFNYFNRNKSIFFFVILLSTCFLILISGERASFFIFFIVLLFSAFVLRKILKIKTFFTVLFLIFIIVFSFSKELRKRLFIDTYNQITGQEYLYNVDINKPENFVYLSIQHDAHARTALKMALNKPLIGHGPNTFRKACNFFIYNKFSCTTHPHSTYLQLFSEVGFLSLIFVLIAVAFNAKIIINKDSSPDLQILSFFVLLNFFPFVPSGNFFTNYLNINFYLIIGFLLNSYFTFLKTRN